MIRMPRWLVAVLGVLFAAFHAGLGFSTLEVYQSPVQGAIAVNLYLVAVLVTVIFYRGLKLPTFQAIINLAVAILVPLIINANLQPSQANSYSTWYVIGIATLMAATAIRRQIIVAWIGTALLVLQVFVWAGLIPGWQTGLAGAIMLVFASHAISNGIAKAYRETMQYTQEALEIQTALEVSKAASEERSQRLDRALQGALPMLKTISENNGRLTDEEKLNARLLEASLRDEIRGRGLLTDDIRVQSRAARVRGVEVVILDEGGLDNTTADEKVQMLAKVAAAISQVSEGRITLRAPAGEAWRVTMVATRPGIAKPDIWLKF